MSGFRKKRSFPRRLAGACLRRLRGFIDSCRGTESVFTEIYRNNVWGGEPGSICSGGGTSDAGLAKAYLEMFRKQAGSHSYENAAFVDLGCGDMEIGRMLIPCFRRFTGVDVVKFVIENHRAKYSGGGVEFIHADIVADQLPSGDVCSIRQVFQHLSNRQIAAVLPKLANYRDVYITEHVPTGADWTPNKDKPQGAGIRISVNSGVDLTAPPFSIDPGRIVTVMEIAGNDHGADGDRGVIRTVLYQPGGAGE